jgi:biotin operon repressor
MSDAIPYDKAFTRARLQAGDDLRRNGQLSVTARLVGLEILSCVNKVSGCAFPSEETIAARLRIARRTVIRAIKELKAAGSIKAMRHGRRNVYFPPFVDQIGANLSPMGEVGPRPTGDKSDADRCQKSHVTCDSNDPLTLSGNPGGTLSEAATDKKPTQREKLKARQRAENEIADLIGRSCLQEMPLELAEDLCRRWLSGDVDKAELFELKQKYEPPAAVGGRRARAAGVV